MNDDNNSTTGSMAQDALAKGLVERIGCGAQAKVPGPIDQNRPR